MRESAAIVPRCEIDVGMVAPSADAISKQDLEDEKIKLAVLKSTSPSNRLVLSKLMHDIIACANYELCIPNPRCSAFCLANKKHRKMNKFYLEADKKYYMAAILHCIFLFSSEFNDCSKNM